MLIYCRACGAAWPAPHGVKWPYCWLSHARRGDNDMDARQLHVVSNQRRTNQRGIWTVTMLFTPISLIMIDQRRFPSYVTTCSTWGTRCFDGMEAQLERGVRSQPIFSIVISHTQSKCDVCRAPHRLRAMLQVLACCPCARTSLYFSLAEAASAPQCTRARPICGLGAVT
jgi:hypothetical protein